jgi:DNA-directed RNA polymerase
MTTVYGVTYVGARDQIEKQLKDRGDIHEEDCWGAASYLAHLVLGCIGNLFSGAKAIQTWLNLCARVISKSIPEERIPELMTEYFADPIERAIRQSKAKMAAAHMRRMKEIEAGIDPAVVEAKIRKASKPQMVTIKPDGKRPKNGHLPLDILKKEQMTSVIWTTPLGLPIVQPYRKTARKQVKTAIQTVYISDPNSLAEGVLLLYTVLLHFERC